MGSDIEGKLRLMRETLNGLHTIGDVADHATTTLFSIIPTDKVALAIIEENILRSVTTIGKRVFLDLNLDRPSINTRAVKSRETQLVKDTRTDPDYFPGDGLDKFTMLSELCVPIVHQGKALGTINFESQRPGRYTEEDAEIAEAFTREISHAVHRVLGDKLPGGEPRACYKVGFRTTLDIYHELLKVVYGGETVLNRILYRTAVRWKRGREMVNDLVAGGYLVRERASRCRFTYKITEKGVKALKKYEELTEVLGEG